MNSTLSITERWSQIMEETLELIQEDETYEDLTAKEKLLSFYYYHLDNMIAFKPFITSQLTAFINPINLYLHMGPYRTKLEALIHPIIHQAIQEKTLKYFPGIKKMYRKFFWMQHLFILRYWATDTSKDNDLTVALIEKAMKSTFDFVGNGELQSSFDFWKFVAQHPFKLRPEHE